MAQFTWVVNAGRRIVLKPSPLERGALQLQILDADRCPLATCTIAAEIGALMAEAFDQEANAAADLLATVSGR